MVERGIEKLQLPSNDGIVLHYKESTIPIPLICNLHRGIIFSNHFLDEHLLLKLILLSLTVHYKTI